jgi:Tol biopolymer transport system component
MKSTKHDIHKKQQLTEAASPKIVKKRRWWFAMAISAVASLFVAIAAFGLTPASGGLAGGTTITINNGLGDQTDPHVNGNLAVYTNSNGSSQIRYYDFVTTNDNPVPAGSAGSNDILSDVFGNLIAFTRVSGGTTAMLFDVSTNTVSEVPHGPSPAQFSPVLGGNKVAFIDLNSGNGDIIVFDLSTSSLVNVSLSPESDDNPSLSPSGTAVVWERCVGSNCDILRSVQSGGTWGTAEVVSATPWNEGNPDTDGTWVVYDSNRPSATGGDIYFQPLSGGPETQLQIAGEQRNPSISNGVIAFESDPGSGSADIFVYVIATNVLLQVTNSPTINDTLNDVTVLGNGDVRAVWSSNDGPAQNVYARTFSIPLGGDSTAPTVTITTPANGATYIKGQSVAADFLCQDETGGSGLASCTGPVLNGAPIDTATVGSHSFSVTATDNAGNSATATNTYNIVYNFNGFFQPVDNLPTLNIASAGSSIPVKFSLGGNQGLAIFAAGFPASSQIQCDASEPGVVIEETVNAGGSSLSYNATTDQYSYVWKTDRAWKGTCRMLVVKFNDDSQHFAKFRFR